MTTIKYMSSPVGLRLLGNDGSFSFHSYTTPHNLYKELDLFATGTVRKFHLPQNRLSQVLEQLPALETLIISQGYPGPKFLSALAREPVLCPSLKTIAFLDCLMNYETVCGLEWVLAKREDSAAIRLQRVVIVNRMRDLPNHHLTSRLRSSVPCVDVRVDDEFLDLLSHDNAL